MTRKLLVITFVSTIAILLSGCGKENKDSTNAPVVEIETTTQDSQTAPETTVSETEPVETTPIQWAKMSLDFAPGFQNSSAEYQPLQVTANAPEYTLNADLSNIENLSQFSNLTEKQREMIAQNGFVVMPTDAEQLFYIYEENTYKKVPSFVTTDSVLQLYHIFYDYSLRTVETDFLYEELCQLNEHMIKQLLVEYEQTEHAEMKDHIQIMIGYFSVSQLALTGTLPEGLSAELTELVKQEFSLIEAAEGHEESPLFGLMIDYSLFQIRGHYTRSEELGKYFQAMSWYGVVPIPFFGEEGERDEQSAARAIVTTIALCRLPEEDGIKLWENIYSTTSFYVGEADDITPYEVAQAIVNVYSDAPDINQIPEKMDDFYLEVEQMRNAKIVLKTETDITQLQMRFMGQRYIPDSEILQKLSTPYQRPFPTGVDVFAIFGSERAEEILDEIYQPNVLWDGYQENYDALQDKFLNQTISEQTSNIYQGWLYSLKSLPIRFGEGYPLFMKNKAWEDKSLATALGSWAEIRHDTILYGKQSAVECGGGEEPPELIGYVEPNPEFYHRMHWLLVSTRENLMDRGYLNQDMQYKMERFEEMLTFLETCALKELNGENLSMEEQYSLLTYGGTLEYLSSSIAEASNWFLIESDTDKNMAVIADVHTCQSSYLEVGVGAAAQMYVAIPQNGRIYLTRGAVFDFYEFVSDQRLTDEAWQEKIKQDPPARPPFIKTYFDEGPGQEVPVPDAPYSTGC